MQASSNSGDTLSRLTNCAQRGDREGALAHAHRLLSDSADPVCLIEAATLLQRMGESGVARRAYLRSVELDPTLAVAHLSLGRLARKEGSHAEALAHLREAVRLEPSNAVSLILLGVACSDAGDKEEGNLWLRKALELEPSNDEASYNLGLNLRDTNPAGAVACFLKALESDSEHQLAHREVGSLLGRQSASPEAEYHLRRAVELKPTDPWAHVCLGNYLADHGALEAAISEVERAVEESSDRLRVIHFSQTQRKHRPVEVSLAALPQSVGQFAPRSCRLNPARLAADWIANASTPGSPLSRPPVGWR
jgi:Flp pilus assembly protein TadD